MLAEPPLVVDFCQEDAPLQIMPNPPLLSSHKSSWSSIHLAHYRQPPWELPETSSNQHIIYIALADEAANVEFTSEHGIQYARYGINEYANGCCGVLPAYLPYKVRWDINADFLHLYIDPVFLSQIAPESVNPDRVEIPLELKRIDSLILQISLALKADLEVDGVGNGFYADSLTTALAAHLIRHYSTRKHVFRAYNDGLSKQKLKQAIEYVNEHLDENPSLAEIADELEMSQYYFCRLFKQSTGMTPHQYLIQQRVERAKLLLRQPGLTITEVAVKCGFTHQSHFAKYFRKITGFTPKQFRQF